ncbi:MAG TPA: hypothetical protein VGO36_00645 [Solirubrobacterales bacterium]|jgi:hypothetical protein|nr:hypothetical protein [Solirubrobacterales bacterium]
MRRAGLLGAIAVLTAIGVVACGSSGPSAEDEARAAAVKIIEATDQQQFCRQLVTDRYLDEEIGGGVAACEKASVLADDPGTARATKVTISGEDDSHAGVSVAIEGGELDGVAGTIELVHEGDRWLLDRSGADFLRSSLLVAIKTVDEGALSAEGMKTCMSKQAQKVSDDQIRDFNRDATIDSEAFLKEDLLPLAEKCPLALAEYATNEFTKGLVKSGKSPAYVKCLRDEIGGFLLLTKIVPELLIKNPGFAPIAALEGIVEGAKRNCIDKA